MLSFYKNVLQESCCKISPPQMFHFSVISILMHPFVVILPFWIETYLVFDITIEPLCLWIKLLE